MAFHVPNRFRVRKGEYATDDASNFGAFFVPVRLGQAPLKIIATDGQDAGEYGPVPWEHVSVSLPNRCPTWEEMAYVKSLFWDDTDCVIQYHPPRCEYVNNHPFCLHLWRPVGVEVPLPPSIFVGLKDVGLIASTHP